MIGRMERQIFCIASFFAVCFLMFGCISPFSLVGNRISEKKIGKDGTMVFQVIKEITCKGTHPRHLQGLVSDYNNIYWVFGSSINAELVKTDLDGNVLKSIDVIPHHGDLTYYDGRIYVSHVNEITRTPINWTSRVKVYSAEDFSFIEEYDIVFEENYIGTIEYYDNHFYIGEDFGSGQKKPKIHKYDLDFNYIKTFTIDILLGKGFENIARFADSWWGSTYDTRVPMLKLNDDFEIIETFSSGFPFGFKQMSEDVVLTGKLDCNAKWMKYAHVYENTLGSPSTRH